MSPFDLPRFAVSVVVVSDYEPAPAKRWSDERRILQALAEQDIDEPFQVVLAEHASAQDSLPDDLAAICPNVTVVFSQEQQSARLKDFAAMRTLSELVAVVEADCLPNPGWLRHLVGVLRRMPHIAVASGRTSYGNETSYKRCLSLVDRSFDDLGSAGETTHVSNNGAVYRRWVLEKYPYPRAVTPFQSARMRLRTMRDAGLRFWFEPQAVMIHAIGGLQFMRDVRRHTGYADMCSHSRRHAREIPRLLWRRLVDQWQAAARLGPRYLRWYDWPLLFALLGIARVLEIPGMLDALRCRDAIPGSAYR